jgi:hypothetical protein
VLRSPCAAEPLCCGVSVLRSVCAAECLPRPMPPVDEGRSVTELLSRPRSGATVSDRRRSDKRRSDKRRSDRRSPGPDGQPAWFPLLPSAVVAAAVAVVVGLVLCVGLAVLGWLTAPGADVVAASRIGTWVWLLANGALLHVYAAGPGTVDSPATAAVGFTGPVAIAPLGLSLLLVFVLSRTSAAAIRAAVPVLAERPARRERRPLAVVVGATVLGYVGLTLVVARWLADGAATVRVDLSRTAVGAAVVGALGAGLGMIGAGGGWRRVRGPRRRRRNGGAHRRLVRSAGRQPRDPSAPGGRSQPGGRRWGGRPVAADPRAAGAAAPGDRVRPVVDHRRRVRRRFGNARGPQRRGPRSVAGGTCARRAARPGDAGSVGDGARRRSGARGGAGGCPRQSWGAPDRATRAPRRRDSHDRGLPGPTRCWPPCRGRSGPRPRRGAAPGELHDRRPAGCAARRGAGRAAEPPACPTG